MLNRAQLYEYVKVHLSLPRFLHSVRTAEMTVDLCEKYGLSQDEGYIAGIAHDMAREISKAQVIEIAKKDGLPLLEEEIARPVLLHGRAAAVLLHTMWGENRSSVLNAIRWHTQGHPQMGDLGMAVYLSDYLEAGRTHISENFRSTVLHMNSLEEMVMEILKAQFVHLREHHKEISVYAGQLFSVLEERKYAKI